MFEEISGLPLHPLAVHAPLVLVPLLIAVSAGYALVPRVRRVVGWTVVALAVMAPLAVVGARQSGEAFRDRLAARDQLPPELADDVSGHASLSRTLLVVVVALAVVSVGMVWALRPGGPADGDGARWRPALTVLTAVAVLALSAAAAWYLVRTGDSGARMVWEGS